MRFTEPSLGIQNQSFLAAGGWQAQVAYQYGYATEFFIGDQHNDQAAPFPGNPPTRKVNLINLDLMYGITNRLSLDLTVPFVSGSGVVQMGTIDSHRAYAFSAGGLGDVSLQAEYWVTDPTLPSNFSGSVGLGFRAPTGPDSVLGTVFVPGTGDAVRPIDEAFELGSGGWGMLLFAQGTAKIHGPLFGYMSGYYLASLREHTEVLNGGALRGVPDTYSGRLGAAYLLQVLDGIVVSVGGRINGVTVSDLIGGEDLYWRRPGYEVFVEPGLTWTVGSNSASFSYAIRAYANKLDSALDVSLGRHVGADFVPYLLQLSYARRF